jgi:hypothetical protein
MVFILTQGLQQALVPSSVLLSLAVLRGDIARELATVLRHTQYKEISTLGRVGIYVWIISQKVQLFIQFTISNIAKG